MNTLGDNVDEGAVGVDGPQGRPRTRRPPSRRLRSRTVWHPAALVAVLTAGAVLLGAPTASAATGAGGTDRAQLSQPSAPPPSPQLGALLPQTGTPSPAPSERPAVRPSISDPGDVTTATVRFHGRGTPGHRVRVTGPAATGTTGCSTTVTDDGSWACIATVRSGPQQVFTVADGTDPALGSSAAPASDVVVPPTVSTSRPTSGPVSGTGLPGATVSLSVAGSSADRTATVGGDGRWTVSLAGGTRDGRLTVSAAQTASTSGGYRSDLRSASSAPRTVVLDRTAPTAPVVTAPTRGEHVRTQPVTVRGTGEPGAVLTVYVDRVPVCRADVGTDGRWTCTTRGATVVGGTRTVTAMQQDAAGNSSPASAGVRVRLSGAAATPTGGPDEGPTTDSSGGATPGSSPPPATPGRTPTGTATGPGDGDGDGHGASGTGTGGTGTGAGTDSGTGTGTGPTGNGDGTGGGTGPGRGPGGVPDWSGPAGDWTAGTAYDRGIPTIQASSSWSTVLVATGIAAGFLVLVAAPLALVGAAVRGRLRNPFAALLGRNRSRSERRLGDDVLPTWAAASIGVGIVAVATLVGVGVTLEARYVRLAVAVLLGTAVTTAAVVLATRWAAGADRHSVGFRVSPWLVLAALVGCALTRLGDLSPALVVGAVLVPVGRPGADTAALRLGSTLASGVRTATARSVALLGVATVGWVLHSVTPGQGFWSALVTEFATTLCVGAVGALVAVLLPVPGSAGAVLVAGARARYVALTVGAVALAAVVAGGPVPIAPSPTEIALATGACAVGAVACWAWLRGSTPGRTPGTH